MNFSEFNKTVRTCALVSLALVLWTIITNGSIATYLHPRSLPLIKSAFILLCVLTLYTLRKVASPGFTRVIDWRVCILFLPIALGVYVKPTGLSSRIAVQKGLASVAMVSQIEVDTALNQSDLPENAKSGDTISIATSTGPIVLLPSRTRNVCDTLQDDSLYVKLDRIYSNP